MTKEDGDIMPWVNEADCIGCGVCVETCPVNAITIKDQTALIDMTECVHCGLCHDACPTDAVRHDGELIPEEVDLNVSRTKAFMSSCRHHLGDGEDWKCLERMIRHFRKERKVVDATLAKLEELEHQKEGQ